MSFYVTLPSNRLMNIFPDHNRSKFSIKFPQTIKVTPQYEVGLAEIQFPNSYLNVFEYELWIHYYLQETNATDIRKRNPLVLITLPAGLYDSTEDFINDMFTTLMSKYAVTEVYYNKASKRAGARLYRKDIEVRFSDTLKHILKLSSSHMPGAQPYLGGSDNN